MKLELENIPLVKNSDLHRFELTIERHTAFIDYKEYPGVIALIHTESPEELAGQGVAKALIEKTLYYLADHDYKLLPLCPLVFAFIKRHREWLRIVRDDYQEKFVE